MICVGETFFLIKDDNEQNNYYHLYDFISLRCKKCCYLLVFFLSLLIRTDTSSCFIRYCWIFFLTSVMLSILNLLGGILCISATQFFFPSKIYNVAYRSPSYIVLLVQQQTEYRSKNTTELSHTQRWRLTADDSSSQNNGGCW